jgi:hypothetical protein
MDRIDVRADDGPMARSPFNSPLVRIAWTDAVSGNKRSTFKRYEPLEIRCGLQFEPSFWTSFDFSQYWLSIYSLRSSQNMKYFVLDGVTTELAGAPAAQLWVGMRFGRGEQITDGLGYLFAFRIELMIARVGGASQGLDQWAMSPTEHGLMFDLFDFDPLGSGSSESLTLVGGAGTPPGTPTS